MDKTTYRKTGAIGALLDEYQKATQELTQIITKVSLGKYTRIIAPKTKDPDCYSIQTIMSHVVQSGYFYIIEIKRSIDIQTEYKTKETLPRPNEAIFALESMLQYTEAFFKKYPNIPLSTTETDKKIKVRCGQTYDIEQLMEHAIMHILRHRRQIEFFLLQMKNQSTRESKNI